VRELLPLEDSVLVFLHIKKTGGISMQKLMQEQFSGKFYGNDHSALSKKIKIKKSDINKISNGSAIANHWSYGDFCSIKDKCNFITIARDPIDRVVSAYNFFLVHHPKGKSFLDYVRDEDNINLFSKSIVSKDFMTEIYLFDNLRVSVGNSKIFKNSKKIGHLNKTRYRYTPKNTELHEFARLNKKDIVLYNLINNTC